MHKNFNFLFQYLEKEKITIDKEEFVYQIQSHPDYPTLLSISDTLSFFGIKNAALIVKKEEIKLLPNKFIAFLKEGKSEANLFFVEINDNSYNQISYKKKSSITINELQEKWQDIVLVVEKDEEETLKKSKNYLPFFGMVLMLIVIFRIFKSNFYTNSFLLFPILGILFSIAALKDLFGAKSEIINNLCNITSSTDCDSVVKSNKWKIFQYINFSDLSIVFFSSQLVCLLIAIFSNSTIDFFSFQKLLLSLSIPLIFVSLYYQKFIEKKWCPICLSITVLIILEFCSFYKIKFSLCLNESIIFGFIYFSILYFWKWIKSLLINQKELKEFQIKSNRFQRNYNLFKNNLLSSNKFELPNSPIILGNRDSKIIISVITSPFCGHCSQVHQILDKIIANHYSDLQIKIIIKTDIFNEIEERKDFYRTLLNIYFDNGEFEFINKLKEWFINKNIKEWLLKNKIENTNSIKVDDIYSNLNDWCKENNFNYTPAIFINGYEYPDLYDRENLEFFIRDIKEDEF